MLSKTTFRRTKRTRSPIARAVRDNPPVYRVFDGVGNLTCAQGEAAYGTVWNEVNWDNVNEFVEVARQQITNPNFPTNNPDFADDYV